MRACLFSLFVLALFAGTAYGVTNNFVSGMGLYAMNLTGQPGGYFPILDPGMLGSIAIDGSPSHCSIVNPGATVTPNVFDGLGESISVEAWIMHPNPADGTYKPFLARHPGRNLGNELAEFVFQIQQQGQINFFAGCGNYWQYGFSIGLKDPQFPSWNSYVLQPDTWTHVAATIDWDIETYGVEIGIVSLYVNGNLIDRKPWGTDDEIGACIGRTRSRATGQPVRIGYLDNSDDGVQTFGGVIDEVRIWNKTLTQRDIQDHIHGLFFDKTNMVAYMGFNEGLEGIFPNETPIIRLRHSFNEGLSQYPCVSGAYDTVTGNFEILPWQRSGLKIHNAPVTTVIGMGSTSGELLGVDLTTPDYSETNTCWVTGLLFTTDATAWYYANNITRTQLRAPFPIEVPCGLRIEYLPGKRAGIDVVLYTFVSPQGFPEPGFAPGTNATTDCCNGFAKMTFRTLCPLNAPADRCGICGGDNTTMCPCYCDQIGSQQNMCGSCGGVGPDCRGCDCIPFSGTTVDCCGICGGSNLDSTSIVNCTNDLCAPGPGCPRVDACGVCGGNNSTCQCVEKLGYPTDRLDYVLLTHSLDRILEQIYSIRTSTAETDAALPSPPTSASNLALAAQIQSLVSYCASSSDLIAQLGPLIQLLSNSSAYGPCGPIPCLPCSEQQLFQCS